MHFVTFKVDLRTFSAPTKFNLCSFNIHTSAKPTWNNSGQFFGIDKGLKEYFGAITHARHKWRVKDTGII